MLFSQKNRTDSDPKKALETEFGFLDRCSWESVGRVRAFIYQCIENYPASERAELIARIRSGDDRHFNSATFELFLHEYLQKQGFLLTPHPELPGNESSRPDFKVECPDGHAFYLEAVLASSRNERDPAGEARIQSVLQYLDDAKHPDFFVEVNSSGYPVSQPSGRRLTHDVMAWLDTLDSDSVLEIYNNKNFDFLPSMDWNYEEWTLTVTAIPCRTSARGNARRLIGLRNEGASMIDDWTPIRDAILKKGSKYRTAELPLIIAVNMNAFRLDQIDEMQALFGQEQIVYSTIRPDEPIMEYARNGAWSGPAGPRTQRCSGAWLFHDISPYTLGRRKCTLYINPWSLNPVPSAILTVPHAVIENNKIRYIDGAQVSAVLGLTEAWPE